ncbi:DNA glycosylase [Lophiostoma macrostomum CBS 122681]|uniref:Adenine DNA glycosylase n=1 Tax=Lophiostoma macrostomum CBS 122681 TaxID=1314788 RepID=A0A6A6SVV7_9PLEO|nr:DNA glycosylase [Lophiostoma macrostomum CBS 122681]
MPTRKKAQNTSKKAAASKKSGCHDIPEPEIPEPTAFPPARSHSASYHWPLLLQESSSCVALLSWFNEIEDDRSMPWRKPWLNPADFVGREEELETLLAKRAYEVWVSEIMLQQTRVSTVIPYFQKWISKWPTIQDLAKADNDEVLTVWKGLGYYSRATRLQQTAKDMVEKNKSTCPIPSHAEELQKFSGIGPYTAGAISSIAFGEPVPLLDGNVARVLSRQLGLYVDVKDKGPSDLLWKMADRLVKHVSAGEHQSGTEQSAVPGRWNQALMELGSTVCTPRPKCDACPIRKTCRAYAEGDVLSSKRTPTPTSKLVDIEDVCTLCEQLDTEELVVAPEDEDLSTEAPPTKKRKRETKTVNKISQYFTAQRPSPTTDVEAGATSPDTRQSTKRKAADDPESATNKSIGTYCALFPKKVAKKKVAEEDCNVCIIEMRLENGTSKWLIEQRPAKGLLASLWQFPLNTLPPSISSSSSSTRKSSAQTFVSTLEIDQSERAPQHVAEIDTLVHVFSHLKLTMHVQLLSLSQGSAENIESIISGPPKRKWVDTEDMDDQTLSTGMRRCWELLRKKRLIEHSTD